MVVAHEAKASRQLYSYYRQFHERFRPFGGLIGLPPTRYNSLQEGLVYENDSAIHVGTANNLQTGRSFSYRALHLSEFAFWRDASTLMDALMNSVPDDPGTSVVVESTANGASGPFYELWQEAADPQAPSEWTALFFAWWEHPEYVREPPEGLAEFQRSLNKSHSRYGDELAEARRYNLTLAQLAWRRWCIDTNCSRSLEKFQQEYPGNPDEAFLRSGRPVFDIDILSRAPVIQEPMVGGIEIRTVGMREQVVFLPRDHGELLLYRRPDPQRFYVIGADVAEGIDILEGKAAGRADPDYSVATVLEAETREQVAKFRARVTPAPFAAYLALLGRWYNWALLNPEANGPGLGVIEELIRLQYPGVRLFRRPNKPEDSAMLDPHKIGFKTDPTTRPQLIAALDSAIRDESLVLRDANTIRECRTFVFKPNGRAEHDNECHDDEVFALALAIMALRYLPLYLRKPLPAQGRPRPRQYAEW